MSFYFTMKTNGLENYKRMVLGKSSKFAEVFRFIDSLTTVNDVGKLG